MKIKIFFSLFLALFLLFQSYFIVQAATSVNLFQITSDGSQQKDAQVYKDTVAYTNFGGTGGIDIWEYDLKTQQNFPIIDKPGQQFLTSLYKDWVVYDDFDDSTQHYSVRLYSLKTKEDILIAGEPGSRSGGVTNGRYVVYIEGGACGQIHAYNLKSLVDIVISSTGCSPVRISDDTVVWVNGAPGGSNIYGYDLQKNEALDIVTDPDFQESPNIFGDNVVYVEYTTGGLGDYQAIKMKNLRTGKKTTTYESTSSALQWPAISDKYVVWSESTAQHVGGVMGANLKTGEVFEIQPQGSHQNSHTMPSIWKDTAAWMAWRTGNGDIYGAALNKR